MINDTAEMQVLTAKKVRQHEWHADYAVTSDETGLIGVYAVDTVCGTEADHRAEAIEAAWPDVL